MGIGLLIGGENGSSRDNIDNGVGVYSELRSLLRYRDMATVAHAAAQVAGDVDEPPPPVLPDVPEQSVPAESSSATGRSASSNIEALPYVEPAAPNSIEGIICSFSWDCDYWIAVAQCESGLRPQAISYAAVYIGLFQVWLQHGYSHDWLLDPYNNTLAAWELSREGTYTGAWPVCQWQ